MTISVDEVCKFILYADDSAILFSHSDPSIISNKLGKVLENVSDWLVDNRLSLHFGKTECILFGPSRKLSTVGDFEVKCHDHVIKSSNQVKYLGVRIDKILKCTYIIEDIIKKVNSRLKFLYRNGNRLDKRSRSTLANSLIQCYFDYCCFSWFEDLSKSFKKKLQILQNKTIRFIFNLDPRTRITCNTFEKVNMLCVPDRVSQLRLNHVWAGRGSSMNFQVPRVGSHNKSNFYYNAI